MSRPPEPENGTPQGQPNVYHPRSAAPPPYEAYTDPAAAHGWQNAYDETAELPRLDDAGTVEGAGGRGGYRATPVGRADRRRRARARASRRLVLAAGALGAVSVAALIAGLSLSGSSPEGGSRGEQGGDDTSPAAGAPADPTGATAGDPATPSSSDIAGTPRAQLPDAPPSPSASDAVGEDDSTRAPSSAPATTSTPPASPTATVGAEAPGGGRGGNPGRGVGNTKGPK